MGNRQFQVPAHIRSEWLELSLNGKNLVRNKTSFEIFYFLVLSKVQQDISRLIERSIYCLPRTPKIIILNDQEGELFILVQEY